MGVSRCVGVGVLCGDDIDLSSESGYVFGEVGVGDGGLECVWGYGNEWARCWY